MWNLNGNAPLQATVYNAAGVAQNATAMTLTVTKPDGTTATPAVTAAGSGVYTATGPTDLPGRYTLVWTATGTNADSIPDEYDVRAGAAIGLLSLQDARQSLNFTSQLNDDELRRYIDSATDLIEQEVGPILPRTVTETVHGYGAIALSTVPVLSITSITGQLIGSWNIDAGDIDFDPTTGIIRRFSRDTFYDDYYTVVYVAGRSTVVPERFRQAARMVIKNLWSSQRGTGWQSDDEETPDPTYLLPPGVLWALKYDQKTAGIA